MATDLIYKVAELVTVSLPVSVIFGSSRINWAKVVMFVVPAEGVVTEPRRSAPAPKSISAALGVVMVVEISRGAPVATEAVYVPPTDKTERELAVSVFTKSWPLTLSNPTGFGVPMPTLPLDFTTKADVAALFTVSTFPGVVVPMPTLPFSET